MNNARLAMMRVDSAHNGVCSIVLLTTADSAAFS